MAGLFIFTYLHMSYTRILIHAVWSTKGRARVLDKTNKHLLIQHIHENAVSKDIQVHNVNGDADHLHCFFTLAATQTVAQVINLIKGESSYWANRNLQLPEMLVWQNEYYAVSVSESHFDIVNRYIDNQEEHHKHKSYDDEQRELEGGL